MTARDAIARAVEAYGALEELAVQVDEEWQYVTDLAEAQRAMLEDLGARLGDAELAAPAATAVTEAIAEIALITDPHRAIDWLSTFPHVVSLAFGVRSWPERAG